jgi:hypothetical protein
MKFAISAVALLLAQGTLTLASPQKQPKTPKPENPKPFGFFVNNTIYQPVDDETVTYPRHVELHDGTILATVSMFGHNPAYFPIFEAARVGSGFQIFTTW